MVSTRDFAPSRGTDPLSVEKIGNTRERLPDGSLLCKDVPFARLGTMYYDPSELIDDGEQVCDSPDGVIKVHRDADQLFNEQVIRSFEGVPVTIGHPPVSLDPDSYKKFGVGHIRNVRRGDGPLGDHLLCDMIVRDREAIQLIESDERREVSPGYDCDYAEVPGKPGHYTQQDIVGNHLAIVGRGRGGRTVRIGDNESTIMAFKKTTWGGRLLKAITTGDADEAEAAIREGATEEEDKPTVVLDEDGAGGMKECLTAITGLAEKIDGLPAAIAAAIKGTTTDEEKKPEDKKPEDKKPTEDEEKKPEDERTDDEATACTEDEAEAISEKDDKTYTGDAAFTFVRQHTASMAETLSPGLRFGTQDSAATPAQKRQALNGMRRNALENALKDPNKQRIVSRIVGRRGVRALTTDALFRAFNEAGRVIGGENNRVSPRSPMNHTGTTTLSDIQKRNRDFWAK